jgi:hypothetical protein
MSTTSYSSSMQQGTDRTQTSRETSGNGTQPSSPRSSGDRSAVEPPRTLTPGRIPVATAKQSTVHVMRLHELVAGVAMLICDTCRSSAKRTVRHSGFVGIYSPDGVRILEEFIEYRSEQALVTDVFEHCAQGQVTNLGRAAYWASHARAIDRDHPEPGLRMLSEGLSEFEFIELLGNT